MQNFLIYLAMIFIMLQAGGCIATVDPVQYSNTPEFGSSVRTAAAEQIANPEAGDDAPVVGIDGKYAAAAVAKYQKGPREKEEAQAGSIFGVVEGGK